MARPFTALMRERDGQSVTAKIVAIDFYLTLAPYRRNLTYAERVGKLAEIGVMDSEPNIRNKLGQGKFAVVFLLQCLTAIGTDTIRLNLD